jgi:hypothetical protein
MLEDYIQAGINDLNKLILLTMEDIEDIKKAKDASLVQSINTKNELIISFEKNKSLIDSKILEEHNQNPNASSLDSLFSDKANSLLSTFREKVSQLHALNKKYARLVLCIGEFYNSLLEAMIPMEMNGYDKVASSAASLKVIV